MIMQIGGLLSGALSSVLTAGLDIGKTFLQREFQRKDLRAAKNRAKRDLARMQPSIAGTIPVSTSGPTFALPPRIPLRPFDAFSGGFDVGQAIGAQVLPAFQPRARAFTRQELEQRAMLRGDDKRRWAFNPVTGKLEELPPGIDESPFKIGGRRTKTYKFRNGRFVPAKRRRSINPLNFKALKRAQAREDAAERVVKQIFRRAERKKTQTVRRRKTRKKR